MENGTLDMVNVGLQELGSVLDDLQVAGPNVNARRQIVQRISRLEQRSVCKQDEVLNEVLTLIKEIVDATGPEGTSAISNEIQDKIRGQIAQIVRNLTDADCAFIRRVHTDGKAVQEGDVYYRPHLDVNENEFRPPRVKTLRDGITSRILFFRPDHQPTIIPDVTSNKTDELIREAHKSNLSRFSPGSPEHNFVNAIRAEVCVPLIARGRPVAGVIAIRHKPYDQSEVAQIEQNLSKWHAILNYLYNHSLTIDQYEYAQFCMAAISRSIPQLIASVSDLEFLRKTATIITCDAGLGWHRALIFLFREEYPSDALCVTAIGGTGAPDGPDWSIKQSELTARYQTLEEYLQNAEATNYGPDDCLYQLVTSEDSELIIPRKFFGMHADLNDIFEGRPDKVLKHRRGDNMIYLPKGDPWLEQQTTQVRTVFLGQAGECDHFLVPLCRQSPFKPLGFIILDCPYSHDVVEYPDLALTQLVFHMISSFMTSRGIGGEGWYERYCAMKVKTNELKHFSNRVTLSEIYKSKYHDAVQMAKNRLVSASES
jgi:hypothetical protein